MAKTVLGVDIGNESLKLALVSGGQVKKTAVVPMPMNLMREGRIASTETMGELLRNSMREHSLRARDAALVLPNEVSFVRSVTMPVMTADQLSYNLPFEFRDYITEEMKDYVFDYAMISRPEELLRPGEDGESARSMELMAVAVPGTAIEESKELLRKAGIKLKRAAPTVSAYIGLIQRLESAGKGFGEYCVLDLGYQAIRMYMFQGERHVVTRVLEIGMSTMDNVISDAYNVDTHLAHTYLLTNYDDCLTKEACQNAYNTISVELMRALNFYRFSNPDSQLRDVWLCGGGAAIEPLRKTVAETLDMEIHPGEELIPGGGNLEEGYLLVQAVGIALDEVRR